jgi:hypothetical protein
MRAPCRWHSTATGAIIALAGDEHDLIHPRGEADGVKGHQHADPGLASTPAPWPRRHPPAVVCEPVDERAHGHERVLGVLLGRGV